MKKASLTILITLFSIGLFAQNNDRRGFQGTVTSALKQSVRADGKDETAGKTEIQFGARTIQIEGEVYEVVKKSFDGKNKTIFTCTKRRGTFDITYTVGESISVVDTGNAGLETIYQSLTEN